MKLSAIIIDDEPLARKRLLRLLEPYNDLIEIIGEAGDGEQGLKIIEEKCPGLIFLDVEMPVMNGFEMLKKLIHNPVIIFTTAYEDFAIKAFEQNSIDYLLKPIEKDRLALSIGKLKNLNKNSFDKKTFLNDIEQSQAPKEIRSLPVKIGDKIVLIRPEELVYIEANEKYVFFHTENGQEYLTDFTLAYLENKLPENFVRIHRGVIVNKDKIKEFHKGFNGAYVLVMQDQPHSRLTSSRSYADVVRKLTEL
jgi:two-component system, LytTR family, response regulator